MAHLEFDITEVLKLLEHAENSQRHSATFEQQFDANFWKDDVGNLSDEEIFASNGEHLDQAKIPAGLILVKDQGVYLLSNGSPGLMNEGKEGHKACYAQGMNPTLNDEWYVKAASILGGDDFAEFIPGEWVREVERSGKKVFTVLLTDEQIGFMK